MTLMELILLLVLITIGASFSIKYSHSWLQERKNRLEWQEFRGLIYQIRADAIAKHRNIRFCLSTTENICVSTGNHLLEFDPSGRIIANYSYPRLVIIWHGFPPGDVLSFSAIGMPKVNGRFSACYVRNKQIVEKDIIISMTGQIRDEYAKNNHEVC